MRKHVGAVLAAMALLVSCGETDRAQTFNEYSFTKLSSTPKTRPSPTFGLKGISKVPEGSSSVSLDGELVIDSTADFVCVRAPGPGDQLMDDFFVDGVLAYIDGQPLSLRINVEFYEGPGVYRKTGQVLVRVAKWEEEMKETFYASWYFGYGTVRIEPSEERVILRSVVLQPEPGTDAKKKIRMEGSFSCRLWKNGP